MALTPSYMIPLGSELPVFNLPDTVSGDFLSNESFYPSKALVVMFICNHCPYVIHVKDELVSLANDYSSKGVSFVAISSNDVDNYPADSPDNMRVFAKENSFSFPYLFDENQTVAKSFKAECTPDFSIWDSNKKCVYRGRLDDSTPGNGRPVNGADIRSALDNLLNNLPISENQHPSMGCNIKWK